MKLASSNGTIRWRSTRKVGTDADPGVQQAVSVRGEHGRLHSNEPLQSMHKTGLWRSRAYQGAEEKADIEMETRNGSVIITEG